MSTTVIKTIFLPIANRQQARNILRTDVLKTIAMDSSVRIVIFTPEYRAEQYRKEFAYPNIVVEGIEEPKILSSLDAFLGRVSLFYINSATGRFLRKQWLWYGRKAPVRYCVSLGLIFLFGSAKFLRSLFRFLDFKLVKDERFASYFETYKPDLVFAPNIFAALDTSFLRHSKRRGIRIVGMINSWDNITLAKYPFRVLPDKLITHNELIKSEAVRYLDMRPENVYVSGIPHFDHYVNSSRGSREAFCARLGIDPKKRILLFAAIGETLNPTEWQVAQQLHAAIKEGKLPDDLLIVMRLHPTERGGIGKLKPDRHLVVDDSKTYVKGQRTFTEILRGDMEHFADSLYYADVVVTTCSTTTIDAAAFDTPSVNIAYDGLEEKPFYQSVRRFYTKQWVHYQPILKSGGTRVAYSLDELLAAINAYLKDPSLDREGRKRIVDEQCYKLDGKSGERIGKFVVSLLP